MTTPVESTDSARQKQHYEHIHDEYEAHYYDRSSLRYRDHFIFRPLLEDLDLNDREVLDLASGSGHNTRLLQRRFPRMRARGVDISEAACRAYERTTGWPAMQADFTRHVTFDRQFDAAVVIGGLHHLVVNLPQAIANLASAVRSGGVVLMMEPSADSVLEGLRRYWYQRDGYFDAPTEHALSHDALLALTGGRFAPEVVQVHRRSRILRGVQQPGPAYTPERQARAGGGHVPDGSGGQRAQPPECGPGISRTVAEAAAAMSGSPPPVGGAVSGLNSPETPALAAETRDPAARLQRTTIREWIAVLAASASPLLLLLGSRDWLLTPIIDIDPWTYVALFDHYAEPGNFRITTSSRACHG